MPRECHTLPASKRALPCGVGDSPCWIRGIQILIRAGSFSEAPKKTLLNLSIQPPPGVQQVNQKCERLSREARPGLAKFASANDRRATRELVMTSLGWLGLLTASYWLAPHSILGSALLAAVGGLFWVRLFILQHDCGHGSFFSTPAMNRRVGSVLGILTMTPFARWRASHAAHHATSGNLSERSWSRDIYLMTVTEYKASSFWLRVFYQFYRNRFVLFFILAPLVFLVEHRRYTSTETSFKIRLSVWVTNLALLGCAVLLLTRLNVVTVFQVFVPFYLVGAAVGVWLFYVQHQFARAYWAPGEEYSAAAASLMGSSVLRLPRVLAWLTAHIGIHHIHHLAPRIPSYRLAACDRAHPELSIGPQFGLGQALSLARGDLWDSSSHRLVTFRQAALSSGSFA